MKYKEDKTRYAGGGCSIFTVLFIVFFVLKLVGVIDWAWIWVFSPLWIGFILALVIFIIIFIGIIIALIKGLGG